MAPLSLLLLISFALITAAAQSPTKRITSIWTATSAEGARVNVISDSPISDYEAYTRGDRFYVKIPLADLPTARGSLLGRGFDDVQIQRYGDGIILSFRLQPGTTARVEQTLNRLEIIFSTPASHQGPISQQSSADPANRTRARRISDAAGPAPSSSSRRLSRQPTVRRDFQTVSQPTKTKTGRVTVGSRSTKAAGGNVGRIKVDVPVTRSKSNAKSLIEPRADESSSSRNSGPKASATPSPSKKVVPSPSPSPSPLASPSPTASASPSPAASASPATTVSGSSASASPYSTPVSVAAPAAPQPSLATTPSPASTSANVDWASRAHYWRVWAELNWLPLLIGGLIGLALLVLMFSWRGMKRRRAAMPKPAPGPSVWREAPAVTVATKGSAPAPQTRAAGQPNSSDSLFAEQRKDGGEDQEREVFEL